MYCTYMTKRITISVPDDVAEYLETVGSGRISSYVSQAVRQATQRQSTERALEELFVRFGRPSSADLAQAREFADKATSWQADRLRNQGVQPQARLSE